MTSARANLQAARAKRVKVVVVSGPPENLADKFDRIDWALEKVLEESANNGGIYPPTGRVPRLAQVLVRAGLPRSFLEKRNEIPDARDLRHMSKKAVINELLGTIRFIPLQTSSSEQGVFNELRPLRESYHSAELELAEARAKIHKLEALLLEAIGSASKA